MAKLTILEFPDPRLRTRAAPVKAVDDRIRQLVDDMFETMYAAPGVGLAATQVDVHQRVMVVDVMPDRPHPLVFINPELVSREGTVEAEEGCLSVPGVYDKLTTRSEKIVVRALDRDGAAFQLEADGLLAICIQHEMDHLEGKLFVDYLSELKRTRIRKKLEKERRERASSPPPRTRSSVPVI
jgi:peptide deformylase